MADPIFQAPLVTDKCAVSILSTAEMGIGLEEQASVMGVELDIIPFIRIESTTNNELAKQVLLLAEKGEVIVFTSKHAVMSVAKMLDGKAVNWKIYCLGNKTKSTVNQLFDLNVGEDIDSTISGIADDAQSLANLIIKSNVKKIVFFCGDKRMDTLPDTLQKAGVAVQQFVVYQTVEMNHDIQKEYNGILFFSPSAVNGFFRTNTVKPDTVLFSIGNTTAGAIRLHTDNKIVIGASHVKRDVFMDAVRYLVDGRE